MTRQIIFHALSIIVSIVIIFVGTEALIRITHIFFPDIGRLILCPPSSHRNSGEKYLYDENLGWRNVPNSEFITYGRPGSTNSQGFRSPDYPIERRKGGKRILILGDSFAWGFNVANEDIFSRVAEEKLRAENVDVDIINTAVSGWGTDQEYLFLLREGLQYKPDIVVLALFVGNDPINNSNSRQYGLEKPYFNDEIELKNVPVPLPHPVFGKIELSSIARGSELIKLILFALWNYDDALRFFDKIALISLSNKSEKKSNEFAIMRTISLIRQIQSLCLKNGVELIVMKFGSDYVEKCLWGMRGQNCAQLYSRIEEEFGKLTYELNYIDLDAEVAKRGISWEEMTQGGRYGHWGESGHRVVGELLADFLVSKLN
jgi:GDSL-like Lipase/Acylhydrolase family